MSEAPEFTRPGERDSAIPRFYKKPVQNNFKSEREGRPIFDDIEFVEINMPGDRLNVVDTRVTDVHRNRWPQYYRAFKEGEDAPAEGTPLAEWPGIAASLVEELRYFKVRTLEQLAALSDTQATKCMPMDGLKMRDRAKRALDAAAGAAPMEKLAAENAEKDGKIAELQRQVAELLKRTDELSAQAQNSAGPQT